MSISIVNEVREALAAKVPPGMPHQEYHKNYYTGTCVHRHAKQAAPHYACLLNSHYSAAYIAAYRALWDAGIPAKPKDELARAFLL